MSQKGVNFIGCVCCVINCLLFIVFGVRELSLSLLKILFDRPNYYFATFVSWFDLISPSAVMSSGVILFVLGVGCLYNLVISVSTLLKYFVRGLNVYSGGCLWDFTLKRGIVFSFWCLK